MSLQGMRQMQGEKRADFLERCKAAQASANAARPQPATRRRKQRRERLGEDQSLGDYEMNGPDNERNF